MSLRLIGNHTSSNGSTGNGSIANRARNPSANAAPASRRSAPESKTAKAKALQPKTFQPSQAGTAWRNLLQPRHGELLRAAFSAGCILLDGLCILACAMLAPRLYQNTLPLDHAPQPSLAELGGLMLLLFVSLNLAHGDYGFRRLLNGENRILLRLEYWALALLGALAFEFALRESQAISRGAALLFFAGGGLALVAARELTARLAAHVSTNSLLFVERLLLVGYEPEISAFFRRYSDKANGVEIVSAAVLRGPDTLEEDLALAVATARIFRPDDIFIMASWADDSTVAACIDSLSCLPAALHMGPGHMLDRFAEAEIVRLGSIASLQLARRPLNLYEIALKRTFDILGAAVGLVLLAPLFAAIAIAIKLDSPGPALFAQHRYGFNQTPFRMYKFRSMTTLEDSANLVQVVPGDPRVTRVGRLLRHANLDELPQLLNVLLGQMSLVGPRPHALAHDHMFARTIGLAARRHNVKPGITGWAQVNGFRNAIDTESIRNRIQHDLYYIDHWSLWFDLRILVLTFSPKAFRNAH